MFAINSIFYYNIGMYGSKIYATTTYGALQLNDAVAVAQAISVLKPQKEEVKDSAEEVK